MSDFTDSDFRHCLGSFATGITIATTKYIDGSLYGVTVNSFSSVSLRPPLVSFCLDKKAFNYNIFLESEFFTISILAEDQKDISLKFASPSSLNWSEINFEEGKMGSPVISGSIAYIECMKEMVYDAGDHSIFIGKVVTLKKTSDAKPLVYFKGQYTGVK